MNAYTQKQKILNYCEKNGSITVRDAFVKLNINSPTKRISEMRNSPMYAVSAVTEYRENSAGENVKYNRYFITPRPVSNGGDIVG